MLRYSLFHFLCDGESEKNLVCFFAVLGDPPCCFGDGAEEVAGVLAACEAVVAKRGVPAVALCTCPTVVREASSGASWGREGIGVAGTDGGSAGLRSVSATPSKLSIEYSGTRVVLADRVVFRATAGEGCDAVGGRWGSGGC